MEFIVSASVSTTFTFTRDEYVLAMKRHYRSTLKIGRNVTFGSLAIAGGAYLLLTSDTGWIAWLLLAAGAVLLAMVGYVVFLLPGIIYNSQPRLKDEYSLIFSDDGIAFKTNNIDSLMQWSIYQSWLSDEDFYIMYHGKHDLSVVPRRALADGDDVHLREFLTKKIGPPKA